MWLVQGHTAKWIAKQRLNPGTLASELMLLTTTQSCLISTGRSSGLHSLRGSGSLSVLLHSREHRVCLNPLAPLGQRLLSWFPFPTIFLTLLSCKNYSQLEESFASSLGFGLGPQKAWSFMNAYDCTELSSLHGYWGENSESFLWEEGCFCVFHLFFSEQTKMPLTLCGQRVNIMTSLYVHFWVFPF